MPLGETSECSNIFGQRKKLRKPRRRPQREQTNDWGNNVVLVKLKEKCIKFAVTFLLALRENTLRYEISHDVQSEVFTNSPIFPNSASFCSTMLIPRVSSVDYF